MMCQFCKKKINTPDYGDGILDYSDVYEYRGFVFHENCFDDGQKLVDEKRKQVMQITEKSLKSQINGEWMNGGYKYMKTDMHTGSPIVESPKEPQLLKDYEKGIL